MPGQDADQDGLSDACELALAKQFAPTLVVSPTACNWNEAAGVLGGAYLFGVLPLPEGGARVAYLPAYYEDCGWRGAKCWVRWRGGCDPHAGDSELILVDVEAGGTVWRATRVFLSAHCFGGSDGRCRWYHRSELTWVGDAPRVWVAEGKNAHYPSRGACESGHWFYDTCERNALEVRYSVETHSRNIGSAAHPFPTAGVGSGCLAARDLAIPPADSTSHECIWEDRPFRGWSADVTSGSATPYLQYLIEVAGFKPRAESRPG